jgi:tetratricopeptide (TPR) repeat protein
MTGSFIKKYFCLFAGVLLLAACQTLQISVRPVPNALLADAAPTKGDFYALGKSYLQSSNLGLAIEAFHRDIFLKGGSVRSFNGLGIAYDMLERYDLSQKYYESALDLDPVSSVTLSNLAYSQYMQGEYDSALKLAGRAKALLAARQKKDEYAVKNILDNLEAAGNKKIKEEAAAAGKPSLDERVQRIGEYNWEIMKENKKHTPEKHPDYHSMIAIDKILGRATVPFPPQKAP